MRATSEDSPPSARRTPLWESVRQIRISRTQTPEDRLPGTLPRGCAYSSRVIAVIRAPRSAAMCLVGVLAGRRAGGGCDHVCARQGCSVPVPEAGGKEKGARTEARDREKEVGRRQERGDGSEDGDGASCLTANTAGRGPHGPPAADASQCPFPAESGRGLRTNTTATTTYKTYLCQHLRGLASPPPFSLTLCSSLTMLCWFPKP